MTSRPNPMEAQSDFKLEEEEKETSLFLFFFPITVCCRCVEAERNKPGSNRKLNKHKARQGKARRMLGNGRENGAYICTSIQVYISCNLYIDSRGGRGGRGGREEEDSKEMGENVRCAAEGE